MGSVKSYTKQPAQQPYSRVLVIFTEDQFHFDGLDSAFYNQHLRNKFNTVEAVRFRSQLERSLVRNMESKGTIVLKASEMFAVNDDVTYETFREQVEKANVQAVLVVNLRKYWKSMNTYYNSATNQVNANVEPNASYNCYLLDWKHNQVMWLSNTIINGIYAGYDTLNNMLARKTAMKLSRGKFIYPVFQKM